MERTSDVFISREHQLQEEKSSVKSFFIGINLNRLYSTIWANELETMLDKISNGEINHEVVISDDVRRAVVRGVINLKKSRFSKPLIERITEVFQVAEAIKEMEYLDKQQMIQVFRSDTEFLFNKCIESYVRRKKPLKTFKSLLEKNKNNALRIGLSEAVIKKIVESIIQEIIARDRRHNTYGNRYLPDPNAIFIQKALEDIAKYFEVQVADAHNQPQEEPKKQPDKLSELEIRRSEDAAEKAMVEDYVRRIILLQESLPVDIQRHALDVRIEDLERVLDDFNSAENLDLLRESYPGLTTYDQILLLVQRLEQLNEE